MRLGSTKGLTAVNKPELVVLTCTIVSPNALASPMTGLLGAAFHIELYQRFRGDPRSGKIANNGVEIFEALGAMTFGQSLDLAAEPDSQIVEVDLRAARFRHASDGRAASPVERVPDALRPMVAAADKGLVCFNEMILAQHDRVRLSALVERIEGGHGGYRTTGAPRFAVRGEATIEEIVETPNW